MSTSISRESFEQVLTLVCDQLTSEARTNAFTSSKNFEDRVKVVFGDKLRDLGCAYSISDVPQVFPDITYGIYGVEVKFTQSDTWRSIANSVFEGSRDKEVELIYIVFGKMGGVPEVRFAEYGSSIIHVRTSHVPRFEIEINSERSLFEQIGVSYNEFWKLDDKEKMVYIRNYAKNRLREGEHLWWIDPPDQAQDAVTYDLEVKFYQNLPRDMKRRLRAEAAFLCPKIVAPRSNRTKYRDPVMYIMIHYGVLCPQARDLFSAGSVANPGGSTGIGGNYIQHALVDIEHEIIAASARISENILHEYWGYTVPIQNRISEWLKLADSYARDWKPSEVLFKS